MSAAAKEVFKGFSYVAPMLYEVCPCCVYPDMIANYPVMCVPLITSLSVVSHYITSCCDAILCIDQGMCVVVGGS